MRYTRYVIVNNYDEPLWNTTADVRRTAIHKWLLDFTVKSDIIDADINSITGQLMVNKAVYHPYFLWILWSISFLCWNWPRGYCVKKIKIEFEED